MFCDKQPLPPAEEKELKDTLQEIIGEGKKVTVEQKVCVMWWLIACLLLIIRNLNVDNVYGGQIDPSIYGGLIVEFQQKVLDMSIRTRAQQMERLLREPVDLSNLWVSPSKTCLWSCKPSWQNKHMTLSTWETIRCRFEICHLFTFVVCFEISCWRLFYVLREYMLNLVNMMRLFVW